jgi:tRNA nucleotidyltransferase (CCA-adding enzyme)
MGRRVPAVKIYRVGGSVRDELLGRPAGDRDWVVVGATPEMLIASGYRPVGRDFPVFLHPETREEYALARTERKHGQGYRGFEFFASPDVTLLQDLERRDLTINAMARAEDGTLIDPFGGEHDLRERTLRHVSPAFAEDPLRVLRVARFAARFDFAVAPETEALLRALSESGELATLAPERVWQELSIGLMEAFPSRMIAVLRECGALARLLPEVNALFGVPQKVREHPEIDAGVHLVRALDYAASHGFLLPVRYGVLVHDLGKGSTPRRSWPDHAGHELRSILLAERLSARLRVPLDCRDAGRLTARWHGVVHAAREQTPAILLDLLTAADALRRPERLDALLEACECDAQSLPGRSGPYAPAEIVRGALAAVKAVDAAAVAKKAKAGIGKATRGEDVIAKAVRATRLKALREWRQTIRGTPPPASRRRRRASAA